MYNQITKFGTIMSVSHMEDKTAITERFNNMVENTRNFNKSLLKTVTRTVANGTIVEFRRKDNDKLVRELSLLNDRYGMELNYQEYKI